MFSFKQFNVDQTGCAMKINTDGVLLGAMADAAQPKTILDIGTGTGVIALMLAQRIPGAQIDAVEIDENAAATAKLNFTNSPFAGRLILYPSGFEEYFHQHPDKQYDLIISNPPFHINSLASPGAKRSLAKHTDAHFFDRLLQYIAAHLTANGDCWLILPLQTAQLVSVLSDDYHLRIKKKIDILSYPNSVPHREILVLSLTETKEADERFIIYAEPKVYSGDYQRILKDFLTIF